MEKVKIFATANDYLMNDNPSQLASRLQALQQELQTERKARRIAEEKVDYYANELEDSKNKLVSFTSWLSHDLRTPLRAISGFSQILSRRQEARFNEESLRYLEHIGKSSNQMERLIQDLLDYYRLEQQAIRIQPIRLHDMLIHVTKKLTSRIRETNAQIHYPSASEQHVFFSDWSLVEIILTQLLKNALTYHRPSVRLSITMSSQFRDNHMFIRVHDNGIGIASEFHQDIFALFRTLHHRKDYPGSGIGLASVKKAVDLLEGKVSVQSKIGEGCLFVVQLPN